ncbi:MAG: serine hydrolase [Acidimicrobiales bacterium]
MTRRTAVSTLVWAIGAFVLVGLTEAPVSGSSTTTSTPTSTSAPVNDTSTTTAQPPVTTTTTRTSLPDPFTSPSVERYLSSLAEVVTAGLYDPATHRTYLFHPGVKERTASIAKLDILATLLYQDQRSGATLSPSRQVLVARMIEDSDNHAANVLWKAEGGANSVAAFDRVIGFRQTVINTFLGWGLLETTAADQLKLLRAITQPNSWLNAASRRYEMSLMLNVTPSQRFGLGATPGGAVVGVKDGWYPEASGWQVNTEGFVRYRGHEYLLSILTMEPPSEQYAINSLNELCERVFHSLVTSGWPTSVR